MAKLQEDWLLALLTYLHCSLALAISRCMLCVGLCQERAHEQSLLAAHMAATCLQFRFPLRVMPRNSRGMSFAGKVRAASKAVAGPAAASARAAGCKSFAKTNRLNAVSGRPGGLTS